LGLVPFWAKDIKGGFAHIDARPRRLRTGLPAGRGFSGAAVSFQSTTFTNEKRRTGKQPNTIALADYRLIALPGL
jgi:hypothetical protein